jgi:hypothetical protein
VKTSGLGKKEKRRKIGRCHCGFRKPPHLGVRSPQNKHFKITIDATNKLTKQLTLSGRVFL